MTRRTGLPGDGRLSGLLDETAETGFGGLHELGLAALEEDGQEHVQLAFLVSAEQDPLHDRIHCIGAGRFRHISVSIGGEQIEMLGIAKQPGGRNAERRGEDLHGGSRRVQVAGLDGLEEMGLQPGLRGHRRDGESTREPPGLDVGTDGHGVIIPNLARWGQREIEI